MQNLCIQVTDNVMKILLISPVINSDNKNLSKFLIPPLALYRIKGMTPIQHQVRIIWGEENVNFDEECDLVGISCMTANSPRAYKIAQEFRKRRRTVVLGGIHPTVMSDEALQYADSVIIGEAEVVWKELINDFENKCLKKKYQCFNSELDDYIPIDFKSMLAKKNNSLVPIISTRGCPYNCDFCSTANIYGSNVRHVPISEIIRYIKDSKAKNFVFLDDNIIGDPIYAKELFKALIPLKIKWYGGASIFLLIKNIELLHLAKMSGCTVLFVGLESISDLQLKSLSKQFNSINQVEDALKEIKKVGILIHAAIIFGFDQDNKQTFIQTVKFLQKNGICSVSFNILTPYPGTKIFQDLKKEGRLLTTDWRFYDNHTVVFHPRNMNPYELQVGMMLSDKKFYSFISIVKRFFSNLNHPLIFLALNLAHRKYAKEDGARVKKIKHLSIAYGK